MSKFSFLSIAILISIISVGLINCEELCDQRRFVLPDGQEIETLTNIKDVADCCTLCTLREICSSYAYFVVAESCSHYTNHTGFNDVEMTNIISGEVLHPAVTPIGPDTTTVRAPKCSEGSVELFPDEHDCSKYIQCANEMEIILSCWEWEMLFDHQLRQCKPYDEAVCYPGSYKPATGTPSPTTTRPTTQLPTECPASGIINIPNPLDCSKYVSCINGIGYPRDCPPSQEFDTASGQCVPGGTGTCFIAPSTTAPGTGSTTQAPTTISSGGTTVLIPSSCPANETINIPNPDDCRKYVSCINGTGYPRDCPNSEEFDSVTGKCVPQGQAECFNGSSPSTTANTEQPTSTSSSLTTITTTLRTTTTNNPDPIECPENETINIPHPYDCRKYTSCINGTGYPRDCPPSEEFDEDQRICVPAGQANCYGSSTPTSISTPLPTTSISITTTKAPNECKPTGSENIPHPTDCTKYITCVDGTGYPRDCPPSEEFDSTLKRCVPAGTANCFNSRFMAKFLLN